MRSFEKELLDLQEEHDALKAAFDNYIAEHTRNELLLRESEKRYKMLVENLNEIIYTLDEQAFITYVSPNIETISGFTFDETMGKRFTDFVHAEDKVASMEQFHKMLTGDSEPFTFKMCSKDGRIFWMRTSAKPLIENNHVAGIQGVLTEITDLKESEQRLNMLISQTPAIIYSYKIIEGETHLTYVNENVKNVLGYMPTELIGNTKLWFDSLHPDDLGIAEKTIQSNLEAKDSYSEYRLKDKSGTYRWLHDKQKVKKNKNGEIEVIGASWDITQRKQAEKELMEAKQKAEESTRLKTAFLANLSHEIRTPMNGILGFAELLQKSELPKKCRKKYIRIITQSGERMLDTLNKLMDISKIEAGALNVYYGETNINRQIRYVYDLFRPEAEKKGIHFSYTTSTADYESVIITDEEKINAILVNLVNNAVKYTDEGSIGLEFHIKDNELHFLVKDTGSGIPCEKQEIIFDRFRQVDETMNRKFEGMGLGLPIAKAYAELLGGKINVKSVPGEGSIFHFTLPIEESVKSVVCRKDKIQQTCKEYDFTGIKNTSPCGLINYIFLINKNIFRRIAIIKMLNFSEQSQQNYKHTQPACEHIENYYQFTCILQVAGNTHTKSDGTISRKTFKCYGQQFPVTLN
jgi:PAS domain S-box-containing protein